MFGLGTQELMIILVIALVLFGGNKLPELARSLGKSMNEFKKGIHEGGSGFPIMLLHGSGPGVSALGNFRLILGDLARRYRVLAFDLIGFGGEELGGEDALFPDFLDALVQLGLGLDLAN